MSLRSLSLVALLSLPTPALAGERLLVAGTDGFVYQTNPNAATSTFEYFACACTGPVNALTADHHNLYVADEFGQLLVTDVRSGAPKSLVQLGMFDITSMAAPPSGLFVGTASGVVARVDPETGVTLDQRTAPAAVRALATLNGKLFAATFDPNSLGAIYSAPLGSGEFTYFSCFCFFDLRELLVDGNDLLAADGSGLVTRIDGTTGAVLDAQWTAPLNAMAVSGSYYLVHVGGGVIGRFDALGTPLGKLLSPFAVRAMLVVKDPPRPTIAPKSAKRP
ncbi:MAG: PQQ-like beta-propeller repeat protein [Planctomycetes bacterium]|nr:PQQ-like beta-propeller repeat protein [Planctomycetota bacterium]